MDENWKVEILCESKQDADKFFAEINAKELPVGTVVILWPPELSFTEKVKNFFYGILNFLSSAIF